MSSGALWMRLTIAGTRSARLSRNMTTTARPAVPLSLKISSGLFIVFGVSAIIEVIVSLMRSHLNLNLGVLSLFVGLGLLRFSPGWRTCGLVFLWFTMIMAPVIGIMMMSSDGRLNFNVFGQKVGTVPPVLGVVMAVGAFALALWQYRVLTRSEIRRLFGLTAT